MKKINTHKTNLYSILPIVIVTYITALLILNFGNMNPIVVAGMPCLALTFSTILKK